MASRLRWRCRVLDKYGGFHWVRDRYPEGDVDRIWIGFVLITAMQPLDRIRDHLQDNRLEKEP
jgi:hypothetical protein